MTFIESYKQNLDKTRLLSQIASFLIAVILLVEVFSNIGVLFFTEYKWTEAYYSLLKILTFQVIVGIIFSIRFILLFLKKPNSVLYSQIVWLISWFSVFVYLWMFIFSQSNENSHSYWILSASKSYLATIPYFYLLISPIHQILHLFIAFFHRK